jgi:hypothetical protein
VFPRERGTSIRLTREVELEAVEDAQRDPWGQALETGGLLVGDDMRILVDISVVND